MTAALAPAALDAADWQARRAAHVARVDSLLGDHLAKRARHGRQSIEEFLLTYYNYRPAQFRRWQPGPGFLLQHARPEEFGAFYVSDEHGAAHLDVLAVLERRRESVEWIHRLLVSTATRPPHFGCFGMHEWAMVYRQTQAEVRHNVLPLRLGAEATAALVDELAVRCSHFDAFRFFTPAARPLNVLQPTRETQHEHDQPACLHANMDVYRWAYKLAPLVPSELIADCFELAKEIRTLDMRASPYDLTSIGLDFLPIETPEGRAEYVRCQRDFAARAGALRQRLIGYCERALGQFTAGRPTASGS
ncbi:3-methyladenine DNA glycosylase [Micromonospora sp. L32]|uniref:3-methyladenine DNA glycosylase n=1 Tax=Micromonospora sp. L32 TaxID=3452214 RepID=UPI003F898D81